MKPNERLKVNSGTKSALDVFCLFFFFFFNFDYVCVKFVFVLAVRFDFIVSIVLLVGWKYILIFDSINASFDYFFFLSIWNSLCCASGSGLILIFQSFSVAHLTVIQMKVKWDLAQSEPKINEREKTKQKTEEINRFSLGSYVWWLLLTGFDEICFIFFSLTCYTRCRIQMQKKSNRHQNTINLNNSHE